MYEIIILGQQVTSGQFSDCYVCNDETQWYHGAGEYSFILKKLSFCSVDSLRAYMFKRGVSLHKFGFKLVKKVFVTESYCFVIRAVFDFNFLN